MPLLQVKNCPERIYEGLRSLAISEHRTIAQQVLAILDDYLNGYTAQSNAPSASPRPRSLYGYRETPEEIAERIERRKKLFERIDRLPKITLPEGFNAADIVRECREEREAQFWENLVRRNPHFADDTDTASTEEEAEDDQHTSTPRRTRLVRRSA